MPDELPDVIEVYLVTLPRPILVDVIWDLAPAERLLTWRAMLHNDTVALLILDAAKVEGLRLDEVKRVPECVDLDSPAEGCKAWRVRGEPAEVRDWIAAADKAGHSLNTYHVVIVRYGEGEMNGEAADDFYQEYLQDLRDETDMAMDFIVTYE
jgi:hypothetical protein